MFTKIGQSDSTMTQGEREVLNEILARKSNVLKNLIDEMENDSWRIKLRRWLSVKKWVLVCRTRFIWDLTYNKNIFKNKKEKYYKNTYEK